MKKIRVISLALGLFSMAIWLIACGGEAKQEAQFAAVARTSFTEWATANGEPYRDVQILTEDNDGFYAHLQVVAWFQPGSNAAWEERAARVECRQVGGVWQCDQWFDFNLTQGERSRRTATAEVRVTATAEAIMANSVINPVDEAIYFYVPAGEFTMGSGTGYFDERVHTVYLDDYWIMRTEVTNEQYGRCVATGACSAPDNSLWNHSSYAQHPVTYVDWQQAVDYATWAGGRLPTEAEWEKACRSIDQRSYPWGNAVPSSSLANFSDNVGDTTAVGSYAAGASPYGLVDMAGNVWEWTADWYGEGYYASSPAANPMGPSSGDYRVLRGGSFADGDGRVRCAVRGGDVPNNRDRDDGFRVLSPGF